MVSAIMSHNRQGMLPIADDKTCEPKDKYILKIIRRSKRPHDIKPVYKHKAQPAERAWGAEPLYFDSAILNYFSSAHHWVNSTRLTPHA
jgi:hypothetical protein